MDRPDRPSRRVRPARSRGPRERVRPSCSRAGWRWRAGPVAGGAPRAVRPSSRAIAHPTAGPASKSDAAVPPPPPAGSPVPAPVPPARACRAGTRSAGRRGIDRTRPGRGRPRRRVRTHPAEPFHQPGGRPARWPSPKSVLAVGRTLSVGPPAAISTFDTAGRRPTNLHRLPAVAYARPSPVPCSPLRRRPSPRPRPATRRSAGTRCLATERRWWRHGVRPGI